MQKCTTDEHGPVGMSELYRSIYVRQEWGKVPAYRHVGISALSRCIYVRQEWGKVLACWYIGTLEVYKCKTRVGEG